MVEKEVGQGSGNSGKKPAGCLTFVGLLFGGALVLFGGPRLCSSSNDSEPNGSEGHAATPTAVQLDESALTAYCAFQEQKLENMRESERRFSSNTSEATPMAEEWRSAEFEKIAQTLADEVGVDYLDIMQYANDDYWDHKCAALKQGRSFFGNAEAGAAKRSDGRSATDALELYYVLNRAESTQLQSFRDFSAVDCDWDTVNGNRFVGCRGISIGRKSKMSLYLVGRDAGGSVLVAPINGTARQHVDGLTHLSTQRGATVSVAEFAGPSFDIQSIMAELD